MCDSQVTCALKYWPERIFAGLAFESEGNEMVILVIIQLAIFAGLVAAIVGLWKIFEKANEPGWAALVPIYGGLVFLRIVGKPWWWIFLFLIPFVNIVFAVIASIALANSFGKGTGFGIGLVVPIVGGVFCVMLGFGPEQYLGPSAAPGGRKARPRRDYDDETEQEDFDEEDRGRRREKARSPSRRDDDDETEQVDEEEEDRGRRESARSRRSRDDDDYDDDEEDRRRRKARRRAEDFDDETEQEPPRKTSPVKSAAPPPVPAAKEPTVVQCPGCNKRLRVPPHALGKKVKCPECGNPFVA
jgi:hypothetical protein